MEEETKTSCLTSGLQIFNHVPYRNWIQKLKSVLCPVVPAIWLIVNADKKYTPQDPYKKTHNGKAENAS